MTRYTWHLPPGRLKVRSKKSYTTHENAIVPSVNAFAKRRGNGATLVLNSMFFKRIASIYSVNDIK